MKLKLWDEVKAYRAFSEDAFTEWTRNDDPDEEFIGGAEIEAIERFFGVRPQ